MALGLAVALSITMTACAAPDLPTDASQRPEERPVGGGRFVEGGFAEIKTLQPILVNDAASSNVTGRIYESLIRVDPKDGEVKPNLGRWSVSSDGLTYSWEIDAKASWSDGKPIVANDFLTGLTLVAKSKKTLRKSSFSDIEGFQELSDGRTTELTGFKIDSADPKKFRVMFTRVFCPALVNTFGGTYVLPTQVFGKYATAESRNEIDSAPENDKPTVASGPFKFKEWKKGDQVVLDKNPDYWRGAPIIDQYVYKVVADSTVLTQQLKAGGLTYATIEAKDFDELSKVGTLRITEYPQLSETYIGWNVKSVAAPELQDKRIRQALAYGLDMDLVIRIAQFGHGTKLVSHHPDRSWAAPFGQLERYAFDRGRAEELIRSAGYTKGSDNVYAKDGKPLAITIVANDSRQGLMQIVVEQYRAIGVTINPKVETFETMVDALQAGRGELQGWIIGWSLPVDPDPYVFWGKTSIPDATTGKTGFNFGSFTAPALEESMVQARTPTTGDCSLPARKKAYEKFNKILNEEQPYNFGFAPNVIAVTQKNLQNFQPDTFGTYWNVEKWWFKP